MAAKIMNEIANRNKEIKKNHEHEIIELYVYNKEKLPNSEK